MLFNQTLNLFDIIIFDTQISMFKKKICKFFFWNFELFVFFFPKKIEINKNSKLIFALKLYHLFNNFDFALKIKFILFILFINFISLIIYFKFFKYLSFKKKNKFINKLIDLRINILARAILALKSQSIIILYSILKGKINDT